MAGPDQVIDYSVGFSGIAAIDEQAGEDKLLAMVHARDGHACCGRNEPKADIARHLKCAALTSFFCPLLLRGPLLRERAVQLE